MILFLQGEKIYAFHDDNTIKQLDEYINDDSCILAEHITEIPQKPQDDGIYEYHWNGTTIDVVMVGTVEPQKETLEEISVKTRDIVEVTNQDILTNMELGMATNETVVMTSGDALLIMEMLLEVQNMLSNPPQ